MGTPARNDANISGARDEGAQRLADLDVRLDDPHFLHYRSLFPELKKASNYAKGSLLDIGCGNKPFEKMFNGNITRYTGCDVIQSSCARADVICVGTLLPFPDGSYDTVLMTQVIEHIADHHSLLREAFRVLRSGGVLILSGPMYWELHEEPYDFFRFTEHGFRFLLRESGFTEIEIVNNGGKWALCGLVLIHTLRGTKLGGQFLIRSINRIFARLDDRHPSRSNTINYVATARKPAHA